jgi:hypothetical protein
MYGTEVGVQTCMEKVQGSNPFTGSFVIVVLYFLLIHIWFYFDLFH